MIAGVTLDQQGRIEASLGNVQIALLSADAVGCRIAWDEFHDGPVVAEQPGEWRPLYDGFQVELRIRLERIGFRPISRKLIRAALAAVSDMQRIDSAKDRLLGLPPWDRRPRVARFCADYLLTKDTPYARAAALYLWTAHVGRILEPGCPAEFFPLLIGEEGVGKSTAVEAIAPAREHFGVAIPSRTSDSDLGRRMHGKLVGEMTETWGFRTRARSRILAWITDHDEWRPKYQVRFTRRPRRSVLWITSTYELLAPTLLSDRRCLPLRILGHIDVGAIRRDRDQLWAEALHLYLRHGVARQDIARLHKGNGASAGEEGDDRG